jgi:hypothetical protein
MTEKELSPDVREQLEKMASHLAGLQEFAAQAFAARQGFYEKLILLDGATLTLLFTVIGGLSHSAITKESLARVGLRLFISCWLFVASIMLSLLHNHLNIATLIHMSSSLKRASFHANKWQFRFAMQRAGLGEKLETLPLADPDAEKDLKKGTTTENICRWVGFSAQALTICGYVVLVESLQTTIQALTG